MKYAYILMALSVFGCSTQTQQNKAKQPNQQEPMRFSGENSNDDSRSNHYR